MNVHYVYVLLDSTKPGKFKFGEYKFDYEPFYVGHGSGNRMYVHYTRKVLERIKAPKSERIKQILSSGGKVIPQKLFENLTKMDAVCLEKNVIKSIGRKDKGIGPLWNITDGGIGSIGLVMPEERKRKISEKLKKYKKTAEHILNAKNGKKDFAMKESTKKKLSIIGKEYFKTHIPANSLAVRNVETGKEYPSAHHAARDIKAIVSKILLVCHGKRHTHAGVKWEFVK